MDASHLLTLVIGAVLGILFLKLLPYCSILFMEVCQKLKTLIASRSLTPSYENLNTREDSLSSESVLGEYDVFLSFHGEDIRNNFVCHLYEKLNTKGIRTFKDDKRLEKGKPISPSLTKAIEKSKISIVVFSPNYASSSWCLQELVKIVKCMETKQQLVLPVFVNIDPSDVEKQRGTFAKAFRKHWISFVGSDRIQKWRDALSKISTIVGWDSRNCSDGDQAELIQRIAGEVSRRLGCNDSVPEDSVVGIDSHTMHIDEKLDLKCPDVRMLGIWGPGGIGKTTIARFIYNKYSIGYGFEACCFLEDIKDKYKQKHGAKDLQKELIFDTLSERDSNIRSKNEGCNVIRRLRSKKVLIVLDDVDKKEQLEVLANKVEWFGPGSRIIVTTRDKGLLIQHDVENVYEVQFLETEKALELFSLHAFKENEPPTDFLELSYRFASFAQCLPLALKVLGRSLYKRKMDFWQDQLDKLGRYPDDKIYQSLKISYDGLGEVEKKVFLDVVFFFDGESKVQVEDILHGFHPQSAFIILEERALLTFSSNSYRNCEVIRMHHLIKKMGYEIVREESQNDTSKRSRSFDVNEIKDVLTMETGGTSMEGMSLNMNDLRESIYLKPNAIEKMNNLRFLRFFKTKAFRGVVYGEIHFPEGFGSFPEGLRYFHWDDWPLKSLPFDSFGENLVELILIRSKLEYLWEGAMEFRRLKEIYLAYNGSLKAFPDLSRVPNIERIKLEGCSNCYEFPLDLSYLQKLKILIIDYCGKLDKLPILPRSLVEFVLSNSPITKLSPGFKFLTNLKILKLSDCRKLTLTEFTEFPQCIGELKSLKDLELFGIPIVELPQTIEHLHELQRLHLDKCENLVRLPSCLHKVVSLQDIYLGRCRNLVSLPKLPPLLRRLDADGCKSLEFIKCNNWNHFRQLGYLSFQHCNKLFERSRNEIMECARVMCHSYTEYRFSEREQIKYFIPRMEIPKWFEYNNCESSITVKLPLPPHQIQGFAFWVAYVDSSLLNSVVVISDLINLKSEVGCWNSQLRDHVVVWDYHFNDAEKKVLTEYLGCELQFNISCLTMFSGDEDGLFKEWGVHMISDEEGLAN